MIMISGSFTKQTVQCNNFVTDPGTRFSDFNWIQYHQT